MEDNSTLFPQEDVLSAAAETLMSGQDIEEFVLQRLERRVLNWLTQPDNLSLDRHPHNYVLQLPEVALLKGTRSPPIQVTTQRTMKVRRLLLFSPHSLSHIRITRFMVGFEEPAQITTGMSAELFRVMSRHPPIQTGNYLNPGMSCLLLLENTGQIDVEISGAILGSVLTY